VAAHLTSVLGLKVENKRPGSFCSEESNAVKAPETLSKILFSGSNIRAALPTKQCLKIQPNLLCSSLVLFIEVKLLLKSHFQKPLLHHSCTISLRKDEGPLASGPWQSLRNSQSLGSQVYK
jgi:hypothetical protein